MRKLGIACSFLFIILVWVGISCASWAETVFINRTVKTGVLSVGIRNIGVNDHGRDPLWFKGPNRKALDIGYISCTDGPYEFELGDQKYTEYVDVAVCGYPSYAPECTIELANCGSIPARINTVDIGWHGDLAGNIRLGCWTVDFPGGYQEKGSGMVSLKKAIKDISIDPGQKAWIEMQFRVSGKWQQNEPEQTDTQPGMENTSPAVECAVADGKMEITYRQWNIIP